MYGQGGQHRLHPVRTPGGVQRMRAVLEEVSDLQRPGQGHGADLPLLTDPELNCVTEVQLNTEFIWMRWNLTHRTPRSGL